MTVLNFATIDDLAAGDVVCRVTDTTGVTVVQKALPAVLAACGFAYGIASQAASRGGAANIITDGRISSTITGLAAAAGRVRVGATGRCELVGSYQSGDYPIGFASSTGNLGMLPAQAVGAVPATLLDPSEVLVVPGTSRAAAINAAALGGGRTIRLFEGTYQLEAPLVLPSGTRLLGAGRGRTVLHPTYTPVVGLADDRTNDVIRIVGALDSTTLNTTLTTNITPGGVAYYGAGARKLSLASTGTLEAGHYICVGGHESAVGETPGGANGSAVESAEILLVDAIQSSPPRVTLRSPTLQHHVTSNGGVGTALFVQRVVPVVGVIVSGFTIDAAGGTIAVGVRVDRALHVDVLSVEVKGFSRAGIEIGLGSRDIRITDLRNSGECCCGLYMSACMNVGISGYETSSDGLRYHTNGLRRASVYAEFNPINVRIDDFAIRHTVQGVSVNGGRHINVSNGLIDDCDIRSQVIAGGGAGTFGSLRGVGLDTGNGEGAYDEYVGPVNIANVTISNCRSLSTTGSDLNDVLEYGALFHDCHQCVVTGLSVVNNGLSDQTTIDGDADYRTFGIGFQDCNVRMSNTIVKGCQYGYDIRFSLGIVLSDCYFVGNPGAGSFSNVALIIGDGQSVDIHNFNGGGGAYVWFSSAVTSPYALRCTGAWVVNDQLMSGPFVIMLNNTGTTVANGDVVAVDTTAAAGTRKFITPASGSTALGVVFGFMPFTNGTYCMVKMLPDSDTYASVSGAVSAGDYIEFSPGSRIAVKGTVPNVKTIGQTIDTKGAGTAIVGLKPTPWLS